MLIKDFIYYRRKELNLTLQDIANYVGVSKGTVQKWESGFIKDMRRTNIALLAQILNISPIMLLQDSISDDVVPYKQTTHFTEREIALIQKYRQLDADGKADIDDLIESKLARSQRKAEEGAASCG